MRPAGPLGNRRVMAKHTLFWSLALFFPSLALGQDAQNSESPYSFWSYVVFWSGATVMMYFMGRRMFREQLGERRTLRRLIDEIGPIYPEFDIDRVKTWVHRCAPHVWAGWARGQIDTIDGYVTDEFLNRSRAELGQLEMKGLRRDVHLDSVLKVHPLDLAMVGSGPAPADVQLTLRLEIKAKDAVLDASGELLSGSPKVRQVQYFWRILHDGYRWRLHEVWPSDGEFERGNDAIDVPQVLQWRRPEPLSRGEHAWRRPIQ